VQRPLLDFSAVCAAPKSATIIISAARICFATRKGNVARGNRCVDNGEQVDRIGSLAMMRGKSVDFSGYWQRHRDIAE
jgi:hypothetical protein